MKKFGIFILLLTSLILVACNTAYSPKVRVSWRNDEEVLTYAVSVIGDYNYSSPYDSADYPAKPEAVSTGTYTTSIKRTAATPSTEYTVKTVFEFKSYFLAAGFPAGYGTAEGDYVYFENRIETTAVFSGTQGAPFQKMISSQKVVRMTDVTKRNGIYNTPLVFNYTLNADYGTDGKTYTYTFTGAADLNIYDIDLSGSFAAGGVDNEILFYYLRAIEMTPDNCSSVSSTVRVPDPYFGGMTTLAYSYVKKEKITVPAGVTEFGLNLPANNTADPYYNCAQISLSASGDRTGQGIQLFYALNDSYSISLAGYPSRREQKLIRMKQSYLQYDLKAN